MMNSTTDTGSSSVRPVMKSSPRLKLLAACFLLAVIGADVLLRNFSAPLWLAVFVAGAPLVPGAYFVRERRRVFANSDELAVRIEYESVSIAFSALLGVVICVSVLITAGALPGFVWTAPKLVFTAIVLRIMGTWLASRHYR